MKNEVSSTGTAPQPPSYDKDGSDPTIVRTLCSEDKIQVGSYTNYHGIDTSQVMPGADAAYEAKISIMNEALLDIGMGRFQWKVFAMTGFGWFVDNVSIPHPVITSR
jgi:hypothetical protein